MAQTIIAQPYTLHPAFNTTKYIIDSTNKNNLAFKYIFDVYLSGTSTLIGRYFVKPRPVDGYGEIDLSKLLSSRLPSEIENAMATSYFNATRSHLIYDVKVGESRITSTTYTSSLTNSGGKVRINVGNTFAVGDQIFINQVDNGVANPLLQGYQIVTASSPTWLEVNVAWSSITNATIDGVISYADNRKTTTLGITNILSKVAFNGTFDTNEEINYTASRFSLVSMGEWLVKRKEHYITRNTPIILDAYLNLNGTSRDVRFENSNGDVLSTSVLGTIVTAINVGTYNTPALSVVSGALPLIKPDTTWYRVAIYEGTKRRSEWITFNLVGCGIEDNSILYIDKYGSILSIPMLLRSTLRTNVTNEAYNIERKGSVSGSVWKPIATEYGTININNKKSNTLEMNTMFMTEAEQNNFFEMIESPRKMLFRNGEFIPVICETKTAEVKSSVHGKVWQYSVTVSFSNNSAVNG